MDILMTSDGLRQIALPHFEILRDLGNMGKDFVLLFGIRTH